MTTEEHSVLGGTVIFHLNILNFFLKFIGIRRILTFVIIICLEKKWISDLGEIMEDLKMDDFKKLKHLMHQTDKRTPIPLVKLEEVKDRCEVGNLVVKTWGFKESVKAIREFMKKLPRNDEFVTGRLKPYVTQFGIED